MVSSLQADRRFASFTLHQEQTIELAIDAESVLEATPVNGHIQAFPTGADFLEGFMLLRDDTIPVVNMKKRIGLTTYEYAADAKIAVICQNGLRLGLLFDDIKDVLRVPQSCIHPIHPGLLNDNSIISGLIKLDAGRRILELLDLNMLIKSPSGIDAAAGQDSPVSHDNASKNGKRYARFVVFSNSEQEYGVPVNQTQEITFLSKIDDVFKNDHIDGAVQLRGQSIAVLSSARLLPNPDGRRQAGENTRVLILNSDDLHYGMIVDEIREIISVDQNEIKPVPQSTNKAVSGIYQRPNGKNVMLIRVENLIMSQQHVLRAMDRLKSQAVGPTNSEQPRCNRTAADHCYLIFSISRNFAIELSEIQEIIESRDILVIPGSSDLDGRVLNLRGCIVPVVNLRVFYGFAESPDPHHETKLIIVRNQARVVALEVDRIITIYKQVQPQKTPSLNPQLSSRKDTLDRLIEFAGDSGLKEHVLVVNVGAILDNHLHMTTSNRIDNPIINLEESDHDSDRTAQQPEQTV